MIDPLPILHVISRLDGYGGARTLRQLAARQTAQGQRPTIAALTAELAIVDELRSAGATVHVLGRRWRFDPHALLGLRKLRRQMPMRLAHAWDADALLYAWTTGRREPLVAAWDRERSAPSWVSRLTGRSSFGLPIAVDATVASPRSAALAQLELPFDARVIAAAGPLIRTKELDEAIWCFELVRVLHPAARFVLFGDGPDRPRLERYAELVSEPGCVQFAGCRADLATLLPHVDVFWQLDPARSLPHALVEAQAAGAPVVASNTAAHREAIAPDATGLLVTPRNRADVARATDRLLSDAVLALRLGEAGAAAAKRAWTIENVAVACASLYRESASSR